MEVAAEKRRSVKVSDLQAFLKERGVSVTGQDKAKLHAAAEIGIEVDPDGLSENRGDVMARKHCK